MQAMLPNPKNELVRIRQHSPETGLRLFNQLPLHPYSPAHNLHPIHARRQLAYLQPGANGGGVARQRFPYHPQPTAGVVHKCIRNGRRVLAGIRKVRL